MTGMDPRTYYDDYSQREWERLDANPVARLEFEGTIEYLQRDLPPEGSVLDAGGGPGRYAVWLAERGYEVAHFDLSREQASIACRRIGERQPDGRTSVLQADLRWIPYATNSFDAICCLGGALSHIVDGDDRQAALAELHRVASPGAVAFVSVIGRLGALRDTIKRVLADSHGLLVPLAETGDYTAELVEATDAHGGFTETHFYRFDELREELESAGFGVETVAGLEGLASSMQTELEDAPKAARDDVRALVDYLREDRTVADLSEHLLAVATA